MIVVTIVSVYYFKRFICVFFNAFSLFISRASGTFLLNMFDIVLEWI